MWIGIRLRWRCCWMKTQDKRRLAAGLAALALAALLIAAGVGRGEMEIVAQKAINICFECIGLG